jgi:ankyrin repeat protein
LTSDGEIAKRLIAAGTNLDQFDNWGTTALQFAAMEDRNAVAEAILASGYQCDLKTAVMLKKRDLAMQMVKADRGLLKRIHGGSNLWGGNTPLAIAAGHGDLELVRFFLDAGADVNQGTMMPNAGMGNATALTNAVWGSHVEVVELLLERGATTNAVGGKFYNGILDYAQKNSPKEIVDLLEKHSAANRRREPAAELEWELWMFGLAAGVGVAVVGGLAVVWRLRKRRLGRE